MPDSWRMRAIALTIALGFACGVKSTVDWEQDKDTGSCPAQSALLIGDVPLSGLCGSATDCAPSCCDCDNDAGQFLAAACDQGYCVPACEAGQGPGGACH
jgi:hypothetical protein